MRPETPTLSDAILRGIDLSHHQDPERINWDALATTHSFAICRATYGATRDRKVSEHVRRARDAGLAIGLYHFFRISKNLIEQWQAFGEVAELVRLGPGDLVPALDLEADTSPSLQPVQPSWSGPLRLLADALTGSWGGCMLYGNSADFAALGNPAWCNDYPLWVAHWAQASEPRCPPGRDWTIWQHRVAVLDGVYPAKIDQNVARLPLPVLTDAAREKRHIHGAIAEALDLAKRSQDDEV